ncbi:polyprenyl synthetase family protein [Sphingobacterium hungaricum]|uniref:Polyprenyl synthetase n=1 Tax=Sphingobacterium hungaricum TaxID=2082723 RepID=A0A928UZ16_9SPHI|nr:polyprenyl synthetase family protein [Sphingobacterium hungaricum]MBE8713694.1 polyprenyl synthetase [Sphingobacterium hungaricum]
MVKNAIFPTLIHQALEDVNFPAQPSNLYDPIRYILSLSGKRIRPMLVLLGADLFGYKDYEKLLPASLAIEYFHNFSLIHDDIMDNAPLRRGQNTVHQEWNSSVAILSGDALLVKAYEELANCPVDKIPSLLKTFNQVALEVCEGQQLDMDFETRERVSREEYIEMIRQKTSVLLGGALKLGAIIAAAKEDDIERIYNFGVNLGIAFQLQDDILDVYGDPNTFGKQVGGDILADKKTILNVLLQQHLKDVDKQTYQSLVSSTESVPEEKIAQVKELYAKYQIKELADELKEHFTDLAYKDLDSIQIEESGKKDLSELANSLLVRSF